MDDIQTCLDAMAAAEQEARPWFGHGYESALVAERAVPECLFRWARDRVALVARDRATLERHGYGERPGTEQRCVQAVIDYWTRDA